MKISEPVIRKGFFWKAGHEGHKVSGTLMAKDGGGVELEIIGRLNEDVMSIFNHELESNFLVYGQLDSDNYATLYNCYYRKNKNSLTSGVSTSIIKPQVTLLGVAFDEENPRPTYKSVYFELSDISSWIDVSGFKVVLPHNQKRFLIDFTLPEHVEVKLEGIGTFKVEFNANYPTSFKQEINLKQTTIFKIYPNIPIEFERATGVVGKIQHFVMLATQEVINLENVKAILSEGDEKIPEKSLPTIVKWYYESSPFQSASKRTKVDALFTISKIADKLEPRLNKWFEIYQKAQPALWLYFSSMTGAHRYSESVFLSLSQSAESYQRYMTGEKKLSFKQRMRALTEPFVHLYKFDVDSFLDIATNTRNYLTHYNEDVKSKSATGLELYFLNKKLKDLMTLNLLKDTGFTPDELIEISNQAGLLRDEVR